MATTGGRGEGTPSTGRNRDLISSGLGWKKLNLTCGQHYAKRLMDEMLMCYQPTVFTSQNFKVLEQLIESELKSMYNHFFTLHLSFSSLWVLLNEVMRVQTVTPQSLIPDRADRENAGHHRPELDPESDQDQQFGKAFF